MRQSRKKKWNQVGVVFGVLAVGAMSLEARQALAQDTTTFTTLHSFVGTDGSGPIFAPLVQGADGNLDGVTTNGGNDTACPSVGCGTIFKMTPSGTLTTRHLFASTDGANPAGALVLGTDGNFYGTTGAGGANSSCTTFVGLVGCGTVFKMTPGGTLTTLHSFDGTDGAYPVGALVQASDGSFYGATDIGGANSCLLGGVNYGCGTIFKITPSGTLTTFHSFDGTDGALPNGGLVQATDGNFYGTNTNGGTSGACGTLGCGTVFKLTRTGTLTTLYSFCSQSGCTDGFQPDAPLIQATDGNFYGTVQLGGANNAGTVFKITSGGALTTLYSFCSQSGCTDGAEPSGGLVQATDGNFYSTTYGGGANETSCLGGCGSIFKITPRGTLTTLYSFCSQSGCADGELPLGALVQDTNGKFYGMTEYGGTSSTCTLGCGTVFSLAVGLGPFVETQPTSGKVGTTVKILGTNLTGATSVTFNGVAATFTVKSRSLITTTVPSGATTGKVKVTTPGGTLTSNVNFRVL